MTNILLISHRQSSFQRKYGPEHGDRLFHCLQKNAALARHGRRDEALLDEIRQIKGQTARNQGDPDR